MAALIVTVRGTFVIGAVAAIVLITPDVHAPRSRYANGAAAVEDIAADLVTGAFLAVAGARRSRRRRGTEVGQQGGSNPGRNDCQHLPPRGAHE